MTDGLTIPVNAATIGVLLTLIAILISVLRSHVSSSNKIQALTIQLQSLSATVIAQQETNLRERKETIERCDKKHEEHFRHASNTGIHQEAMSKETSLVHFDSLSLQLSSLMIKFQAHTVEDMEVLRDIRSEMKSIRELCSKLNKANL